jgi:pimeloyl-ACP methyl ester carboxylesterase
MTAYAYLHGFASSPSSRKGLVLADAFAAAGHELHLLDLNRPSFSALTLTAQLEAVDAWAASHDRVSFVGSSMGAWVATRWAELNPSKIERLVLLAPAFEMLSRWPKLLGEDAMARWEASGTLPFPDAIGIPTPVHYGFIEDARRHPPTPSTSAPTLIMHGLRDAVVPIELARRFAHAHPNAAMIELDDQHELITQLTRVTAETTRFLLP